MCSPVATALLLCVTVWDVLLSHPHLVHENAILAGNESYSYPDGRIASHATAHSHGRDGYSTASGIHSSVHVQARAHPHTHTHVRRHVLPLAPGMSRADMLALAGVR